MSPGSSFLSWGEAGAGKVEVIWAKTPTGWTESISVMLHRRVSSVAPSDPHELRDSHITVCVLILEQERSNVGLASLDSLLDSCDNCWVADDDGLVEPGEERSARDGECEHLGVEVGDDALRETSAGGVIGTV